MSIELDSGTILNTQEKNLPYISITPHNVKSQYLIEALSKLPNRSQMIAATLDLINIKTLESPAWLRQIRATLRQNNLDLIGVFNPQLNLEICKSLKIPVLSETTPHSPTSLAQRISSDHSKSTIITKPVRSGQQVYAKNGDLIVQGSLSNGGEAAAKNSIYIYGKANGKIIAGANGNTHARIYITQGYPELVSVAGITWLAEDISTAHGPNVFYLNDGQLIQEKL
ncbi:septum site-determining protein MinC [Candidatus Comchoanobacter bicostacola]|uniref:Probable septum site-determining protein MinC n=1 Tax=Candidatus Comchoanobacter bicostacola TaxID=2919598 RepID=A0ABY5DM42_9GAMM|nr:septum site-determining protein MinC [Candidatus Comchoanobacter bicostacola]UTC24968.1 septum site-determining protein MinC [Candidatus Comchoanobacter bicostacola]